MSIGFAEEVSAPSYVDEIDALIENGGKDAKDVWRVINALLQRGYYPEYIVAVLSNKANRISERVRDAEQEAQKALAAISVQRDDKGKPYPSQENIRVALLKLGVRVRHDRFAGRTLLSGLEGFGPALDDDAVRRLFFVTRERFGLHTSKDLFYEVIQDTARLNEFHPVLDYLNGLKWDGTKRIGSWLSTYAGADSSGYVEAVGELMLIAAVRRIRRPGCKFDEMAVLESPQGKLKSQALRALAVKDEWFSDDLPLDADGRRAIEALQGKWIVEAAELSGMRKGDIDHLKAMLSRQEDRGRMAYARLQIEKPRQCIIVGTTNSTAYLRDTTGNRRFWPVKVKEFDVDALKRDRDQLWAEAAAREAEGASIRLDQGLWDAAGAEQEKRLTDDPFFETLAAALGEQTGKVSSEAIWDHLRIDAARRTTDLNRRIADAMTRLGWRRPDNRTVSINGRKMTGWVKGEPPFDDVKLNI